MSQLISKNHKLSWLNHTNIPTYATTNFLANRTTDHAFIYVINQENFMALVALYLVECYSTDRVGFLAMLFTLDGKGPNAFGSNKIDKTKI